MKLFGWTHLILWLQVNLVVSNEIESEHGQQISAMTRKTTTPTMKNSYEIERGRKRKEEMDFAIEKPPDVARPPTTSARSIATAIPRTTRVETLATVKPSAPLLAQRPSTTPARRKATAKPKAKKGRPSPTPVEKWMTTEQSVESAEEKLTTVELMETEVVRTAESSLDAVVEKTPLLRMRQMTTTTTTITTITPTMTMTTILVYVTNNSFEFFCNVTGEDDDENDDEDGENVQFGLFRDEVFLGSNLFKFIGNNVSHVARQLGPYECRQSAKSIRVYEVVSMPLIEFINGSTQGDSEEKSVRLIGGETRSLVCKVRSYPDPVTIRWIPSEKMKVEEGNRTQDRSVVKKIGPYEYRVTWTIKNARYTDSGEYTCEASNAIGTTSETIKVIVRDFWAAIWPALGIVCEVVLLTTLIFLCEKRHNRKVRRKEAAAAAAAEAAAAAAAEAAAAAASGKASVTASSGEKKLASATGKVTPVAVKAEGESFVSEGGPATTGVAATKAVASATDVAAGATGAAAALSDAPSATEEEAATEANVERPTKEQEIRTVTFEDEMLGKRNINLNNLNQNYNKNDDDDDDDDDDDYDDVKMDDADGEVFYVSVS